MFEYVSSCCSAAHIRYADHHRFTLNDLKRIRKSFEQLKGNRKLILTTEKDAVRFRELANSDLMAGLPVYVLPIQVSIQPSLEFDFDQTIQSIVSKNVSFLDRMHKSKFNL
jgi:tetraacyldisaccharide 4'-kinase